MGQPRHCEFHEMQNGTERNLPILLVQISSEPVNHMEKPAIVPDLAMTILKEVVPPTLDGGHYLLL